MSFRENLKEELKYKNILVKELAAQTNINKRTLDNYLRENESAPTAENAVKIAQALGVTVEFLVTGKDLKLPKNLSDNVIELSKEINRLNEDDFQIVKTLVKRLNNKK